MLFEFLLSLLIIAGAGFMIYRGIASEFACGVISLVTGFWFTKRSNESAVNTLLKQPPVNMVSTPTPLQSTVQIPVQAPGQSVPPTVPPGGSVPQ